MLPVEIMLFAASSVLTFITPTYGLLPTHFEFGVKRSIPQSTGVRGGCPTQGIIFVN
jgi:hypothetical protein